VEPDLEGGSEMLAGSSGGMASVLEAGGVKWTCRGWELAGTGIGDGERGKREPGIAAGFGGTRIGSGFVFGGDGSGSGML
jgi:hypothetical protein